MNHDTITELLPWYVNGTLAPHERAAVEAELASCPLCAAELEQLQRIHAALHEIDQDAPGPSESLMSRTMARIEEDTLRFLFLLQPVEEKKQAEQIERKRKRAEFIMSQQQNNGGDGASRQVKREGAKVGRNDPCPCGSGKKFKKCHGVTV